MEIISFKEEHLLSVVELSNLAFGVHYLPNSYFESFLTQKNRRAFVVFDNQQVVAFITTITCTSEKLKQHILKDSERFNVETADKVGIIKQLVVKENYQQKGIATKLIKYCLYNISATYYIYIAWKKAPFTPIIQLMNKNGFNATVTIQQYWKLDSLEKKYDCPICSNPCNCDAVIYITKKQLR